MINLKLNTYEKIGTKEGRQRIKELIEEADRMGFKKGTFYVRTIKREDGKIIVQEEMADHRAELFHTYPDEKGISLTCGPAQGLIYIGGKWIVEIDKKRSIKYW